jgi:3-oxoacyl-[acyl-carrier protein] reductase
VRLKDRVALISGAGSGIGRATALVFAREGARVACADLDAAAAEKTAGDIVQAGGAAFAIGADVSLARDVAAMVNRAVAAWGRLDVLFNNAGIPQRPTPIESFDDVLYERLMAVNVRGVYLGVKHAVPVMKQQGGGVIINTASTAAIRPRGGLNVYCATKGAVIALTSALALELAPFKIRVCAIAPVVTDTPMLRGFMAGPDSPETRKALEATVPLGRLARPEDIAHGALFLASDEGAMLTGSVLPVDGGRCI